MTINEFGAKKLGEVLAFCRLGTDTLERGRSALVEALGEDKVVEMEEKNKLHGEAIVQIATDAGVIDTTLAKTDKTLAKLTQMRDLYIGDQWDNATEILEWSGFYEGAFIVHWNVVKGCGQALNHQSLLLLCEEGINWHYEMLELCESELEQVGADKATA